MKVNMELVTTDENGDVSETKIAAVMEYQGQQQFRLVYVSDLSGDKKMTRTTILINPKSMRVTRRGALVSDFIYEEGLVHHSMYKTAYGDIAVTLKTTSYKFEQSDNGRINAEAVYFLDMGGSRAAAPVKLLVRIEVG
ncbi:MAG: DUF1934 domain-containing protein [Clostridium sp.]|nr:DUF1934 domain-containing protein [Clostridium sp.]MCM1207825.1 DUF1934 domain-containing protein [Ruminococcus sp.]